MLCAAASGSGKTTVTCAVLSALKEAGDCLAAFKCGPDYIDPMFHSEVLGLKSRNLDLFLMGEEACLRSLWENGGGLSVIEGAMGYYDGIAMSQEASAYQLSRLTRTPAVLVLDGRGQALSAAAVVKGFVTLRPDAPIRGVIFNRVSPMLYPRLREAVERETGVRAYGFLPECPDCTLESRHLGLVTAAEVAGLEEKLGRLAELARKYIDLSGLRTLAESAGPLEVPPPLTLPAVEGRPRIAVARDRAFCFYYADALTLLERLGAELVPFSPLTDRGLPEGCGGLYLGGGYPELYAQELAENSSMLRDVREAVEGGLPTIAECGGFLYLHRVLADDAGRPWTMTGVLPAEARNAGRLSRFGYVTLTAKQGGLLGPPGMQVRGHEFHYWDSTEPGGDFQAVKPLSNRGWRCGVHREGLYAGFPHFHFCGCPEVGRRFLIKSFRPPFSKGGRGEGRSPRLERGV